jgi:hypothetical protein
LFAEEKLKGSLGLRSKTKAEEVLKEEIDFHDIGEWKVKQEMSNQAPKQ